MIAQFLSIKFTDLLLQSAVINPSDKDSYEFCFEYTIDTVFYIGSLIFIGILTFTFRLTALYILVMSALRKTAGGAHASTRFRCSILSYSIYGLTVFMSKRLVIFYPYISLSFILLCSVLIAILAPVDPPNKKFMKEQRRKLKKYCAIFLIAVMASAAVLTKSCYTEYVHLLELCTITVLLSQTAGIFINKRNRT